MSHRSITAIRIPLALAVWTLLGSGQIAAQRAAAIDSHPAADTTCAACRDFYRFANQAWLDTATIPVGHPTWGAFQVNAARTAEQLRALLAGAAAAVQHRQARGAVTSLGTFYSSCLDTTAADAAGIDPLTPTLASIDSVNTAADVMRAVGRLQRDGIRVLFTFTSDVNRTGSHHYVAMLQQGGLTLPGRSYYVASDSAARAVRDAYVAHIARIFALAGESATDARGDAARVLAIESALARASMTSAALAQASVETEYRAIAWATLRARTPGLPWAAFLHARRVHVVGPIIVSQPEFVSAIAHLLHDRPVADWRAYLRWRVLDDASPWLPAPFATEAFHFSQRFSGVRAPPPRWQRCVDEANADLLELLGRGYAERTFAPSSKARIEAIVREIRAVLVARIRVVPWLTDASRREALAKAAAFRVKIGYPDQWHDYSSFRITPGPFVAERAEARRFESDRLMARIGDVPNRAEWDFHGIYHYLPQSPTDWANWDEIIFPAAAVQPPFFDSTADRATNYGAIGVIIAHEITHLFTADGGTIDARGNIRRWWTTVDSVRFAAVERRIVAQYDRYTLLDSATHVNGEMTLDENLADIGGVELAYAALERLLAAEPHRAAHANTPTPEQRFFLAYARVWAEKATPEYLRLQLATDGHAPAPVRANGALADFPPFAKAFGCRPGDPMVQPDSARARIW